MPSFLHICIEQCWFKGFWLFLNLLQITVVPNSVFPLNSLCNRMKMFLCGLPCWLCLRLFVLCLLSLATVCLYCCCCCWFCPPKCFKFTAISGLLHLLLSSENAPPLGLHRTSSTLRPQSDITPPNMSLHSLPKTLTTKSPPYITVYPLRCFSFLHSSYHYLKWSWSLTMFLLWLHTIEGKLH